MNKFLLVCIWLTVAVMFFKLDMQQSSSDNKCFIQPCHQNWNWWCKPLKFQLIGKYQSFKQSIRLTCVGKTFFLITHQRGKNQTKETVTFIEEKLSSCKPYVQNHQSDDFFQSKKKCVYVNVSTLMNRIMTPLNMLPYNLKPAVVLG